MTDLTFNGNNSQALLGRRINHDPRNRAFPFTLMAADIELKPEIRWDRRVGIYRQRVGSCVLQSGFGALSTGLGKWSFKEDQVKFEHYYADCTDEDPFPGTYPQEDTGTDATTLGKVFTRHRFIIRYEHVFTGVQGVLAALQRQPVITGTWWTRDMFNPNSTGQVRPLGGKMGGHEYTVVGYQLAEKRLWFANSWGYGFGVDGHFWMSFEDYGGLLADQGDATVLYPSSGWRYFLARYQYNRLKVSQ